MKFPQLCFLAAATLAVTNNKCECRETTLPSSLQQRSRRTMIWRITGYLPTNDVADVAELDLDQDLMEELVLTRELNHAKSLYEEGGHSLSYAFMQITSPQKDADFPAGSVVRGLNDFNQEITGTLMEDLKFASSSLQGKNVSVKILYDADQILQPTCSVGALHYFNAGYLNNCYTKQNVIQISDTRNRSTSFNYSYNIHTENFNALSLRKVATYATEHFQGLENFEIFKTFYGQSDYADRWAMAAVESGSTGFRSGLGNADFQVLKGRFGHGEGLIKGSAVLNINMYVLGKLELSVKSCQASNFSDASYSLDQAVALYSGSLADTEEDGGTGLLMYGLANNRAINFKTAGHSGDKDTGTALVNIAALNEFKRMQANYLSSNSTQCADAANSCMLLATYMKVPIIQSVLAYAYIRDRSEEEDPEEIEKNTGKGATYTAALLPYIHACSPKDAAVVYDFMRIGSDTEKLNYVSVKQALERTYACLGVTCAAVGGIWDGVRYSDDAEPCGYSTEESKGSSFGAIFGVTLAAVLCFYVIVRYRKKVSWRGRGKYVDSSSVGTIAAVSEIS